MYIRWTSGAKIHSTQEHKNNKNKNNDISTDTTSIKKDSDG